MFSVDNFYDFFNSNYGWNKTKNLIMVFQPHGSKDWHQLTPYGLDEEIYNVNPKILSTSGRIIMHDQEPLSIHNLDTYRKKIQHSKNKTIPNNSHENRMLEILYDLPSNNSIPDWLRLYLKGNQSYIICHSEKNSSDIYFLKNHGFQTCYYWWHGMIARDWFRHWQHYDDLHPQNRSSSKYRFLLYARDCTGTRYYRQTLIDYCINYHDQVLHAWNSNHIDSSYSAKISIKDSQNSAIHIVAETLFDTDKIYLTEKVFKPMVMSQPFILFGPPRSLEYLRNYGFQTFGDFWDESYDLENDSDQRMSKLLDLIDNIASLSVQEFHNLYQRLLPVIKHNRQRFYSEKFQDDLILELQLNMERALFEQNQGHQHRLDDESSTDGHDV